MESMFLNRLKKNHAHLRKWARRIGTEAYRVYDKDIPEFPFTVDLYGTKAVVSQFDEGFEDEAGLGEAVCSELAAYLGIPRDDVFLKIRRRIKAREDQYGRFDALGVVQMVEEQGLKFEVNLSDYLDTGLFLDHRASRAWVRSQSSGKRVLNLFCYTGSVSVYAAAGGAVEVCSVDLSNTYLDWARTNMRANGFNADAAAFEFLREDVATLLAAFARKGRTFDLVFCDPPSFSNSKRMDGHFDVQEHHVDLLRACGAVLHPAGTIFFSNNNRKFKIDADSLGADFSLEDVTSKTLPEDFRNKRIHNAWLLSPRSRPV